MKYTLQNGVQHPVSEKLTDNRRFILPVLLLLVGAVYLAVAWPGHGKHKNPLTLGIYTVKSSDGSGSSGASSSGGSTNLNGSVQDMTTNPQLGVASSVSPTAGVSSGAISPTGLGGRGGGLPADTTPAPAITTTPPPSSDPSSCVTAMTSTGQVCYFPAQACTMPLSGLTGYKTIDGTCVIIN